MNYASQIKHYAFFCITLILLSAISYRIGCYFEWREPIVFTMGHLDMFISGTITFVFLSPIIVSLFLSEK